MGYTFTIGNAVPKFSKDDGELAAQWEVEPASSEFAPTFPNDEMTGNGNMRSPSYSTWNTFCKDTGIHNVFYDDRGNITGGHPGCVMIKGSDMCLVREALARYRKIASLPPGFEGFPVFDEETKEWKSADEGKYDGYLARLIWLEWWMDWALANCETPAIQNT